MPALDVQRLLRNRLLGPVAPVLERDKAETPGPVRDLVDHDDRVDDRPELGEDLLQPVPVDVGGDPPHEDLVVELLR